MKATQRASLRFLPISPLSSDLVRFAFHVLGNTPICSDLLGFLLSYSDLTMLSEQIKEPPFCWPLLQVADVETPGLWRWLFLDFKVFQRWPSAHCWLLSTGHGQSWGPDIEAWFQASRPPCGHPLMAPCRRGTCISCTLLGLRCNHPSQQRPMAALKGTDLRGQTVFCGFLRFPAKMCPLQRALKSTYFLAWQGKQHARMKESLRFMLELAVHTCSLKCQQEF